MVWWALVVESEQFETVLTQVGGGARGLAFVGVDGSIVAIDSIAEFLLGPFVRPDRRIIFPEARSDNHFQTLLRAACSESSEVALPPPLMVVLPQGSGLVLDAFRVPQPLKPFHPYAQAVLVVRRFEAPAPLEIVQRALSAFGLSPAEVRLCAKLASGLKVNQIAAEEGKAEGTVRQQLKSVFRKTGATSQADLVRLMLPPIS